MPLCCIARRGRELACYCKHKESDDSNDGCLGDHSDRSFIVPAKNLKVGKQSDRLTVTQTRSELDEDDGEDEEHNSDAIEEQEAEHESESELEVNGPSETEELEEEIPPFRRVTRQRTAAAESESVEERYPLRSRST